MAVALQHQAVWAAIEGGVNLTSIIKAATQQNLQDAIAALINYILTNVGAITTVLETLIGLGLLAVAKGAALTTAVKMTWIPCLGVSRVFIGKSSDYSDKLACSVSDDSQHIASR